MSLSDGLLGGAVEVDAGRADELRHDDTLGAVDDERALLGHEREVAHEHRLGLDLTREVVHELGVHVERRGEGLAALLALVDRVLGLFELGVRERELHRLAEVFDRGDLLEDLVEAGALGRSVRPAATPSATRAFQASLPTSQSKLSVCRASRSGTVRVSVILANESRDAERPFLGDFWWMRCAQQPRK